MTTDFTDNQMITAEDLNNVAVDLGITDYSHFNDETEYAVDELNEITKALVNPGVLPYGNRCVVGKSGNTVTIGTGKIIFASGAKINIDTVQSLDVSEGGINYIYAKFDTDLNKAELIGSVTEPQSTEDIIPLAEISANGDVLDRRVFATSKMGLPAPNREYNLTAEINYPSGKYEVIDVITDFALDIVPRYMYYGNKMFSLSDNFQKIAETSLCRVYVRRVGDSNVIQTKMNWYGNSSGTKTYNLKFY